MSQKQQNLYEVMYIFNSALTDDALKKVFDQALNEIKKQGGSIVKIHDMGRRRLAYEIDSHREGHYYLVYFEAPASAITEMKSEYRLMQDMVRYMILRANRVLEKLEFNPLAEV